MENKKTEEKVFSFMEEHHMLKPGDHVVVGVSGGADSVCLLFLLSEYAKRVPIQLTVVHINHGIREDASGDAEYVRKLCASKDIPYFLKCYDIPALSKEEHLSEEEAGRRARYEAFYEVADKQKAEGDLAKIAVAHHANDCAETMLFHLFRGSGLTGLSGIRPVRDRIIRPLLILERWEIEEYLRNLGIDYCHDSTNDEDEYSRNRIRHHLIPYAEENICKGAAEHVSQAACRIAEAEDYIVRQVNEAMKECVAYSQERRCVSLEKFHRLHPLLQKRLFLEVLKDLTPQRQDISAIHVKSLLELAKGESGKSLDFPYRIHARKEYESLIVEKKKDDEGQVSLRELPIAMPAVDRESIVDFADYQFRFCVRRRESVSELSGDEFVIPQNKYTKWIDYAKIEESLVLRTRASGDYLVIRRGNGEQCHKNLKDYMITEKIPRQERDTLPVLCCGSQVLWLVGYRISENIKVTEETELVLQVTVTRKKNTIE